MSSKINRLLQQWPPGVVGTARWLESKGADRRLVGKYVRSGWLERIGHGACKRAGAAVDWPGAVHALQAQLGLDLHLGAVSAFELHGYMHYLVFGGRRIVLFGKPGTKLPAWFSGNQWSRPVTLVTTGVFSGAEKASSPVPVDGIDLDVATLEQAAFEMMYLVPKRQSCEEAFQIMEFLAMLRPWMVQQLLESCTSVKAKRLFMHAAERLDHPWVRHLDLSAIDFGSGRRTIHAGGRLERKYNLVIDNPVFE